MPPRRATRLPTATLVALLALGVIPAGAQTPPGQPRDALTGLRPSTANEQPLQADPLRIGPALPAARTGTTALPAGQPQPQPNPVTRLPPPARLPGGAEATRRLPPPPTGSQTGGPPTPPPDPRGPAARTQPRAGTPAATPDAATTPPRRRPPPEDDPFAPVGLRLGVFEVKPGVEISAGYDSNPGQSANGRGAFIQRYQADATYRSLWTRHEASGELRGSFLRVNGQSTLDRPEFSSTNALRLDLGPRTRADLTATLRLGREDPGSPNLAATAARAPDVLTAGATAGLTHTFNRLEATLRGTVERTTYGSSLLTDGTRASNDDRNVTTPGMVLRVGYEASPALRPFVEVGVDRRLFDRPVDSGGIARGSTGQTLSVGTTFEITRLLTGEASVGWARRAYEDATLRDVDGLLVDASLVWTATPLTTVTLTARSEVEDSTSPGVSAIFKRDVGLSLEHAFRRWLIGTAGVGFGLDDFRGSDTRETRSTASVGLVYKASSLMQVKGEVRQEWLSSNVVGRDYSTTVALIGLRLQR